MQKLLFETKRQMLHAFSLKFVHPFTFKDMSFEVKAPKDFEDLMNVLRGK